jgi:excinuclease UvrABC ATPase subunit
MMTKKEKKEVTTILCSECKGSGMVKSTEHSLDHVYEECDRCDGSGYVTLTK